MPEIAPEGGIDRRQGWSVLHRFSEGETILSMVQFRGRPIILTDLPTVYEVVGGNEVRRIMPQVQIDGGLGYANVEGPG